MSVKDLGKLQKPAQLGKVMFAAQSFRGKFYLSAIGGSKRKYAGSQTGVGCVWFQVWPHYSSSMTLGKPRIFSAISGSFFGKCEPEGLPNRTVVRFKWNTFSKSLPNAFSRFWLLTQGTYVERNLQRNKWTHLVTCQRSWIGCKFSPRERLLCKLL